MSMPPERFQELYAQAVAKVDSEKRQVREAGDAVEALWRQGYTFPGYDIKIGRRSDGRERITTFYTTFTQILETDAEGNIVRANHLILPSYEGAYFSKDVTRPTRELLRDGGSDPMRKSTANYFGNRDIDFDPLALLQGMHAAAQPPSSSQAK